MKEFPIRFNGDAVLATLDGRKTQTRQPVKIKVGNDNRFQVPGKPYVMNIRDPRAVEFCPYGQPGDRLWVRETFLPDPDCDHDSWDDNDCGYHEWEGSGSPVALVPAELRSPKHCIYRASWDGGDLVWRPSIHMPRWASRIILEITSVRVERLQDITAQDVQAEGVNTQEPENGWCDEAKWRGSFRHFWDLDCGYLSRNLGWSINPWVWAVEFKMVEGVACK